MYNEPNKTFKTMKKLMTPHDKKSRIDIKEAREEYASELKEASPYLSGGEILDAADHFEEGIKYVMHLLDIQNHSKTK